jgi:hypothetical protein
MIAALGGFTASLGRPKIPCWWGPAMRSLAVFFLLAGTAASAFAMKRVTVAQLEQEVAALQGKTDGKAARQLADLQLTERLSATTFARLQTETPGPKARQALLILADTATFLDLPPAEVTEGPAPDLPTQRRILTQTINYVTQTLHQLPSFSATRATTRFQDTPRDMQGKTVYMSYSYQPLHLADISSSSVVFRDGQEVVDVAAKSKKNELAIHGLTTRGEFGPILFTVLLDMTHSTLKWSHWEHALDKTLAVFAFTVPREQSHYQVGACCLSNDPSHAFSGYRGQIAVDPANGTVFRIVVQAELKPTDPISRADILVEYGPVEIGGKSYICPVRSVAILVDNTVPTATAWSFPTGRISPTIAGESLPVHTQTQVDDVAFTQYHLFRAESRMVVVGTSDQQEAPNSSGTAPEH